MFVGYTEHHSRDVYRMLNLTTNSIINSRDAIWLKKTCVEWKKNQTTISTAEDDTIELPTGIDKRKLITNETKDNEDEGNELDKKVFRAMRKLESWFNSQATKAVGDQ
jgi:tRNA A37 threonylcarbamoyladenosine biosynthesis protein TsaE